MRYAILPFRPFTAMNTVEEARKYHLIFHHRTCDFLDEGFMGGQSLRDENVIIDEKALSAAFREKVRVVAISRPCLLEAELLTQREVETENLLSSVGISPQNGWIADYPVTPDIMGEIQKSMIDAVDSKKLSMSKD